MNDYTLADVFETVYRQEFSEFDNPPKHFFSHRHRKAMKEILYPQTTSMFAADRNIPLKKRVIIALLVILLSALGITAAAAISRGFTRKEHRDNTELFAANAENAPKTIENVYYLPEIPEGYELHETVSDNRSVFTSYMNLNTNRCMVLFQSVKEGHRSSADNEHHLLEEVEINGHYGLYLGNCDSGSIFWDNGDYILELSGDFNKDELLNLAKSAKL